MYQQIIAKDWNSPSSMKIYSLVVLVMEGHKKWPHIETAAHCRDWYLDFLNNLNPTKWPYMYIACGCSSEGQIHRFSIYLEPKKITLLQVAAYWVNGFDVAARGWSPGSLFSRNFIGLNWSCDLTEPVVIQFPVLVIFPICCQVVTTDQGKVFCIEIPKFLKQIKYQIVSVTQILCKVLCGQI